MRGPWYISVRAVRDYLAIQRRPDVTEGTIFEHAEQELIDMAINTVASGRVVRPMRTGAKIHKGPRPLQLRFIVVDSRGEGDLPQLVNVWPAGGQAAHSGRR